MKNFLILKQLGVFLLLLCNMPVFADDLMTEQFVIKVETAGTLNTKIGNSKKYKITNLKLEGKLNGTDFRFIREMAGNDLWRGDTDGHLENLDLVDAEIVGGGDVYESSYYTQLDEIGVSMFQGCKSLKTIKLPHRVTQIGSYAFYGCTSLVSVEFPDDVICREMGTGAFMNCVSLMSIVLPNGLAVVPEYAFWGCGVQTVVIPEGVKIISKYAFSGCNFLTSISLPSSLEKVEEYAFDGVSNVHELNIANLESYLQIKGPSVLTPWISYSKAHLYINNKEVFDLEIPSEITKIPDYAFENFIYLTSVFIHKNVNSIGYNSFSGCSQLNKIYIEDLSAWCNIYISTPFSNDWKLYLKGNLLNKLWVSDDIDRISDYAFANSNFLEAIYLSRQDPPLISTKVFGNVDLQKCTLYVPKGTYQAYWLSNWGDFENIVEYDVTGIDKTAMSSDVTVISRYSVNGQRLTAPTKGVNIVKYSDGSVRKEIVK